MPIPLRSLALALAVAAGAVQADDVQRLDLKMSNYQFDPDVITVKKGMPVELTLKNESALTPHDFSINDPALKLDQEVAAGGTATLRFTPTTAGDYRFYCDKKLLFFKSHDKKGMHGTLKVE